MKKKLNTEAIKNELEGSVFFSKETIMSGVWGHHPAPKWSFREEKNEPTQHKQVTSSVPLSRQTTDTSTPPDTMIPRYHDTNHDTMISSNHDTMIPITEDEMVEEVRRAVRQIGKEPATQRLTLEEKQALADIEYSYKRQGMKTSVNEIIRIATNYIVRDYQQNGENSMLAKVLKRLNS